MAGGEGQQAHSQIPAQPPTCWVNLGASLPLFGPTHMFPYKK